MSALNLINLPTYVLIGIFNNLSIKDMLNCSLVCKKLHEVVRTPSSWRQQTITIPACSSDKLESFIQYFEPISLAKKISYTNCESEDPRKIRNKLVQIIGDCKCLEILEIIDRCEPSNKLVYKLPKSLKRLEYDFHNEEVYFTGTEGLKELKYKVFTRSHLPPFIERCTNLVSLEIYKGNFSLAEIMTIANLENLETLSLRTSREQDISEILIEALKKCTFSRLTKLALNDFALENGDVFEKMAVQMPQICSFICNIDNISYYDNISYTRTFKKLNLDQFAQYLKSQPNITQVILSQNQVISYGSIQHFLNRLKKISKMNTRLCFQINFHFKRGGSVYEITAVKDKTNNISVSEKYFF